MLLEHNASEIGLAIVIFSVLIAWFMNYRLPKVRAFGTFLAALGCMAVVVWFVGALGTGIIEDPKPNQTPMDSAKPALLWLQAAVALVAALLLFRASALQIRSIEELDIQLQNEPERYGLVSRLLHWTIAILFIAMIPMGMFASMIPIDTWFVIPYIIVHKSIGILVLILLLVRVLWNRRSRRPELDSSLKTAERKWAHRVHILLYGMMIAMPVTGYMMTSLHGYSSYFFFWEFGPFWDESETYRLWGLFHKYVLPYTIYVVLGAHILGALKHHFIDRHTGALKRMVG